MTNYTDAYEVPSLRKMALVPGLILAASFVVMFAVFFLLVFTILGGFPLVAALISIVVMMGSMFYGYSLAIRRNW